MSNWLQIDLALGSFDAERLEDALLAAGALAVTYKDGADDPVLEPWPGEMPLWRQTRVTGMFTADMDVDVIRTSLLAALDARSLPEHRIEILEDRDWSREWLKSFKPVKFGRRLWVVPTAYAPPEPNAVNLTLDPGLAFGTGTHPTTALCLEWLDTLASQGELENRNVLDYGCGSGILAVAAALLGADRVVATDIDPQALILARPLIELSGIIAAELRPGGRIALAGLLRTQAVEVADAYRAHGIALAIEDEREGWARLTGVKRPS
jgi:ribosomal protein L11 methyltransferase